MPGLRRAHRRFLNAAAVYTGAPSSGLGLMYAGQQTPTSLGTYASPLFSSVPVGAAYPNRRVLVAIITGGSYLGAGITDILINGSSVGSNKIVVIGSGGGTAGSFSGLIIWAWADVPSGTSITVDATIGGNPNGSGSWTCAAYTFDKTLVTQSTPTETHNNVPASSGVSVNTGTIATHSGGFLISAVQLDAIASSSGLAITASSETMTNDYINENTNVHRSIASKKSNTLANASSSVTWSWVTNRQAIQSLLHWY